MPRVGPSSSPKYNLDQIVLVYELGKLENREVEILEFIWERSVFDIVTSSFVLPIVNIMEERSKPMHIDSSPQEDEESQASENDTQMTDDAL